MHPPSTQFSTCRNLLLDLERHRVWSLIVSFFGDLAQSSGDQVSGSVLNRVGELAGVKPEAMRVAIHRLRQDGWIDSERVGRNSLYYLTEHGRTESAAASPKIYGPGMVQDHICNLVIAASTTDLETLLESETPTIKLDDRIAVRCTEHAPTDPRHWLVPLSQTKVPQWVGEALISEKWTEASKRLHGALSEIAEYHPSAEQLTPLEIATIRMLIVHSWRRVALREPDVPAWLLPDSWKGRECRKLVAELLNSLPPPSLETLQEQI